MHPLLNRSVILAALTIVSALLTHFGLLPAGAADVYAGEVATIVLALATGNYALAYRTALKLASGESVDTGNSVR